MVLSPNTHLFAEEIPVEPNFDPALVAALSALGGALVGAFATALTTIIAQRAETRRTKIVQEAEMRRTTIVQEAETRRHLRDTIIREVEAFRVKAENDTARANQQSEPGDQLVNLTFTDYLVFALYVEDKLHHAKFMDEESLHVFQDALETMFTNLMKYRWKKAQQDRRDVRDFGLRTQH